MYLTPLFLPNAIESSYEVKKSVDNTITLVLQFILDNTNQKVTKIPITIDLKQGKENQSITIPCIYLWSKTLK
jgi:hypothetical protein